MRDTGMVSDASEKSRGWDVPISTRPARDGNPSRAILDAMTPPRECPAMIHARTFPWLRAPRSARLNTVGLSAPPNAPRVGTCTSTDGYPAAAIACVSGAYAAGSTRPPGKKINPAADGVRGVKDQEPSPAVTVTAASD